MLQIFLFCFVLFVPLSFLYALLSPSCLGFPELIYECCLYQTGDSYGTLYFLYLAPRIPILCYETFKSYKLEIKLLAVR